jgi:ferredoxin
MKIRLDRTVCDGFGLCAKRAPGYFSLDDWGYASLAGDGSVPDDDRNAVMRALLDCPVHAITADDDAERNDEEERRTEHELGERRPDDAPPPSSIDEDPAAHLKTEANEAEWGFTR